MDKKEIKIVHGREIDNLTNHDIFLRKIIEHILLTTGVVYISQGLLKNELKEK